MNVTVNLVYLVSAALFIFGLKLLGSPATARRGNLLSSIAMLLAVAVTLFDKNIIDYQLIAVAMIAGTIVGVLGARFVAMTAMPEMVAILNGFGGIASLLVGAAEFASAGEIGAMSGVIAAATMATVLIGGLTFTGSLVAWAKLRDTKIAGISIGKSIMYPGQQIVNGLLVIGAFGSAVAFVLAPEYQQSIFIVVIALSLLLGVMSVIPIGGADMPVVISLLNSYSGLAACAAGFVLANNILIIAGALVGASGIILTSIMCKAMNRSLSNVLFSGFGAGASVSGDGSSAEQGEVKPVSAEDAYYVLEAAASVCVVPGYGLAVAQAQHAVRELGELLENNGAEVTYAIHPVAGRMPGHMNVLLAEANVPYDQLVEMDEVNPIIDTIDVVLVIGANDVVNPAAREDESSAIYGMPIINVDKARTVIVMKRGMSTGFAGIQNPLFFKPNTRMLFGDAKASLQALVSEFKDAG